MDMDAVTNPAHVEDADKESKKQTRERSRIEFPYTDLENAAELTRVLYAKQGMRCETNQLAIWLGQTASGGTFRTRLSAARLFGLVETDRSHVWLTDLGHALVDHDGERGPLVSAFLNAPLYRALYDQFKGHVLPPPAALERKIVHLGVSEKQKERARQAFMKSAQYVGFVDQQSGRLIKPATVTTDHASRHSGGHRKSGGGGSGQEPPHDPLIEGLFKEVPERGSEWSAEDQVRWLETAAHIFALVFKRRERIKVEIEPES